MLNTNILIQQILEQAERFFQEKIDQSISKALKSFEGISLSRLTPIPEDQVLTFDQLCKLLDISRPTGTQWMRSGKLPYKRMGRRVYFVKQDVLSALQSFNRRAK